MNIRDKYTENEASASNEFVYYVIDEHRSLAVLTLSQCEYNQEYVDCLNQMFTEVKQKNIKNIAKILKKQLFFFASCCIIVIREIMGFMSLTYIPI